MPALSFIRNNNKQKIILHIGPHKTASTYIQQSLFQDEKLLNDMNIEYPKAGLEGYGHHRLSNALFKKQYKLAKEIINQILNTQYNTIIISSEDFYYE